jgi:hypothetical protein
VAEVVEQPTTGFSAARSRLEAQWARGEEASTEEPSSLAKALPRVLPAAALGLKRLPTEAPCCCVGLLSALFV